VLEQIADMIKRIDRPERQVMIRSPHRRATPISPRSWGEVESRIDDKMNDGDLAKCRRRPGGSFLLPLTTPP